MLSAYKDYWKKYFSFSGRSTRSDFWWVVLANILIGIVATAIGGSSIFSALDSALNDSSQSQAATGLAGFVIVFVVLYQLLTIIPNLSLQSRRIIDTGLSGWWFILVVLAYLLPGASLVALLNDAYNAAGGSGTLNSLWLMILWAIVEIVILVINLTPTDAFGRHRS